MLPLTALVTGVLLFGAVQCRQEKLKIFTVATEKTDGFKRFLSTAKKYHLDVEVLGMGEDWRGGDMANGAGGGQKIKLLKAALESAKDERDLVVMFVDSYDLILAGTKKDILKQFGNFKAKVVFSAEGFCWPDKRLQEYYPEVASNEKRFLNSGGYIGYAPELYAIVSHTVVEDKDDDQLYFTKVFLDKKLREMYAMKLDTRAEMFQNLHGALDEVKVKFKGAHSYLYNIKTGSIPMVIHGNGPIKSQLNSLTNYLPDVWTPTEGCLTCLENSLDLSKIKDEELPKVLLSIHLPKPMPFVTDFFEHVGELHYPKSRMDLVITYGHVFHEENITNFVEQYGKEYNSAKVIKPTDIVSDAITRDSTFQLCVKLECDYVFMLDGLSQLEHKRVLKTLIERNRQVIAPMLVRPGKLWSTFWGALSPEGFYKRADDYADIAQYKKTSIWNVPYISQAVLFNRSAIDQVLGGFSYSKNVDPDMSICHALREKGIFMYVDNLYYYGHLVNADEFNPVHLHNDMYELFQNPYTWEKKYIHPEHKKMLEPGYVIEQPCTDVFWMPIMTPTFCQHLVEEVEHFGKWSGGKNEDARLAGGYENVPTVDIHMNQIGWEKHWLEFLKLYIAPLATNNYIGYYSESRALMNFMVRYRPSEQDRLRPHHDSSTFTINVALNRIHEDYEGGGVRFTRYNCTVIELRQGWMLMHPGRLTHQHEGLPTVSGTRYIMVSFIDP